MYFNNQPQWPQGQGFGGTPYPVFIPMPANQPTPDGKPPSTKPMSAKKQYKQWLEFQTLINGGPVKKEEKKDDKPKVPSYTFPQVALFFLAFGMPVGLVQLWGVIAIAKSLLGPMATSLGVK